MNKVRVIFRRQKPPATNLAPFLVQEKVGLLRWRDNSRYNDRDSALRKAKELEGDYYEGEVIYTSPSIITSTGYGY